MTPESSIADHVLIVEEDKIAAVAPAAEFDPASIARIVPLEGLFIIPGLWDMHVHVTYAGESVFPLFLAHGVTGIRDMGGDYRENLKWRDEIAAGTRLGPRMKTAGPIIESARFVERIKSLFPSEPVQFSRVPVSGEADASAAVERVKSLGADFLKVRTHASRAAYLEVARAARQSGMTLTGHAALPYKSLLEGGQRSLEHFANETLSTLAESDRRAIWREMAANGVATVPTIVNGTRAMMRPIDDVARIIDDTAAAIDPRRRYVSARLILAWREQVDDWRSSPQPGWLRTFDQHIRNYREMHGEGVCILPGTDMGVALMYPGATLHEELHEFVDKIGMTPLEALQRATRDSAAFLGFAGELGTIEPGMTADFVVLRANPLEDIRNTQAIEGVFYRGVYYDRSALDGLLEQALRLLDK